MRDARRDFSCSGRAASDSSAAPEMSSYGGATGVSPVQLGRRAGTPGSPLALSPVPRIERKIQFEYVNTRLAQKSPLPVLRVLKNQARDFSFWNLAFRSHATNLKLRRRWRDIRIESRTRCSNQIDRDGNTGILGLQLGDVSTDASNQLRIGRAEI